LLREREEEDDRRRSKQHAQEDTGAGSATIVANAFAGVVASAGGLPPLHPSFVDRGRRFSSDSEDGHHGHGQVGSNGAAPSGARTAWGDNDDDDDGAGDGSAPAPASPRKSVRFSLDPPQVQVVGSGPVSGSSESKGDGKEEGEGEGEGEDGGTSARSAEDAQRTPTSSLQFDGILARLGGTHRHTVSAPAFVPETSDILFGITAPSPEGLGAGGPASEDEGEEGAAASAGFAAGDQDVSDAVHRAESEFARRQVAMERNIRDYERTIVLKEDRLRALQVREL
jgi:hypothetical protein